MKQFFQIGVCNMSEEFQLTLKKISGKWQERWEKEKIFEANPSGKEKYFITFPYPYVNGAPHVGHSYSLFRTDVMARFKRMKGFEVLFPQGFHATGEPILGVVERLRNGDRNQEESLLAGGATPEAIKEFKENGPEAVALYWVRVWKDTLRKGGVSIDWRRSFVTTTLTPAYSRFIEWQYETLKKKGYVVQGTHPVVWCPKDQSPTGDHDRYEGEGESPIEFTVIKFQSSTKERENIILPCATLRPETIFGVTNIWVNPEAEYSLIEIQGERWVAGMECVKMLQDQLFKVKEVRKINGRELVGLHAIHPLSKKLLPVLPAKFVDPSHATGIVMSVPGHAPFDYISLQDLRGKNYPQAKGIREVKIIDSHHYSGIPAIQECERRGIKTQSQREKLEEATKELYKKEFHEGALNKECGKWAGIKVGEAKEKMQKEFRELKIAESLWETTGEVVCRCMTKCHVKILENQWFLSFSDEEWKGLARKCLEEMLLLPPEARSQFEYTIGWLENKACARKSGLGTPLPWDKQWIVETLGDSTIYMSYYTLARIINEKGITEKQLPNEVFDFVFNGVGKEEEVSKNSGLPLGTLNEMKNEFNYFYPLDMRNSGKDLITNHLTFMIFHHVALFSEKNWPKGISVNGYVNVRGEKMSKRLGNIIPLPQLIERYGTDLVRVNISASSEGLQDADWREESIASYEKHLQFIYEAILKIRNNEFNRNEQGRDEKLLESRMNQCMKRAGEAYEAMNIHTAALYALFQTNNALKAYLDKKGSEASKQALRKALKQIVLMLCPIVPHFSEECFELLGEEPFASTHEFPAFEEEKIDPALEFEEKLVENVSGDARNVLKVMKQKPSKVVIISASREKWREFLEGLDASNEKSELSTNFKNKELLEYAARNFYAFKEQNVNKELAENEYPILFTSKELLSKQLGMEAEIEREEESKEMKASKAMPLRPAILFK